MKSQLKSYTLLVVLCLLSVSGFCQKYKFGKVTNELLTLSKCDIDSNANAMITYKSGYRYLVYNNVTGVKSRLNQKMQYKIFNTDAKDIGSVSFYYYSPKSGTKSVRISSIKGRTYNLEGQKIIETKINDENIFTDQWNNYYKRVTIAMPNIKKGSVFEYEYDMTSDYFSNVEDWYIQEDFPVLYNEFEAEIPSVFVYQFNILGGIAPVENGDGTVSENAKKGKFFFKDVPALVDEPYVSNPKDNRGRITFQLNEINVPGEFVQKIAGNYNAVNTELLEDKYFGKIIDNADCITKLVTIPENSTPTEKAKLVYDYFSSNVHWDEINSYLTSLSCKELFKKAKGDVADINLNYIGSLRSLGLDASAVLLSTRGNGTLHPIYPDYSAFNYVIAAIKIGEQIIYSDATSGLPFGFLPVRCINGMGWNVAKPSGNWINMRIDCLGKQIVQTEIDIEENKAIYASKVIRSNYFAFRDIEEIESQDINEFYKDFNEEKELTLDSIQLMEQKETQIKLKDKYRLDIADPEFIYVKPFVHLPWSANPFKREKRNAPIDFPITTEYKFISTLEIPEGYKYEPPTNLNAAMADKSITLKYSTSFNPTIKKLTVLADFKVNASQYLPDVYNDIKISIETMLNKMNEPVVLTKI